MYTTFATKPSTPIALAHNAAAFQAFSTRPGKVASGDRTGASFASATAYLADARLTAARTRFA